MTTRVVLCGKTSTYGQDVYYPKIVWANRGKKAMKSLMDHCDYFWNVANEYSYEIHMALIEKYGKKEAREFRDTLDAKLLEKIEDIGFISVRDCN